MKRTSVGILTQQPELLWVAHQHHMGPCDMAGLRWLLVIPLRESVPMLASNHIYRASHKIRD